MEYRASIPTLQPLHTKEKKNQDLWRKKTSKISKKEERPANPNQNPKWLFSQKKPCLLMVSRHTCLPSLLWVESFMRYHTVL